MRTARYVLISLSLLLFAGLIAHSVLKVRYPVLGKSSGETSITRLSITDKIERDKTGAFVSPKSSPLPKKAKDKACST